MRALQQGSVVEPREQSRIRGLLCVFFAAVLWSTSGFFAKAPWFDGWPEESRGLMLAFWRSAFAAFVLVPMIRRPKWQWQLVPMTICFAIMVWSFMSAMVYGPAANAIWLQYLAPVWVAILGVVLLRERLTSADIRMVCLCAAGVLLILVMELRLGSPLFATSMGVLSGVSFAGVVLSMRSLRGADPAWLISLNHAATALLLLPWILQVEGTVSVASYGALAMFGVFQMSVPYILFARGLNSVTSAEASVISLVEPVLVPVWVYVAWNQHPDYEAPRVWTLIGGAIIFTALLMRYLPVLRRSREKRLDSSEPQHREVDSSNLPKN